MCIFAGGPVLALTGTADKETRKTIFMIPNRQNLRIPVTKTSTADIHLELDWLVDLIRNLGADIPKQ